MVRMYCMSKRHDDTVAIRFPKGTWLKVRQRALARGETGLAWLSRCAEVCLRVSETGSVVGGVKPEAVEPPEGSVAKKNEQGGVSVDRSSVSTRVPGSASGRSSQMGSEETGRASSRVTDPARCACGHLETVHRQGKRCESHGCDCRGFAPVKDPA